MAVIRNFPRIHFDFGARDALAAVPSACGIARPLMMTDRGVAACGVFDLVRDAVPDVVPATDFDETPANPTLAGAAVGRRGREPYAALRSGYSIFTFRT